MKTIVNIALVAAFLSLLLGIISRFTLVPIKLAFGTGIEAEAFLAFTNTCLLIAIAFMVKAKQ